MRRHVFGVGPLFISGVEYRLTDHLHLLAEYGFQIRYERGLEKSKFSLEVYEQNDLVEVGSGDADRTTNAVIFDSFPVRFGLRVNF